MLEFNYRQAGEKRSPRHLDDGISFIVRYAAPGAHQAACEKRCHTRATALNFCVILRNRGGQPIELLQLIWARPDPVVAGQDMEEAIALQRPRLQPEAAPPWR